MHWRSRRNYNSNLEIGKHTYRYIINKRLEAVSRIIANLGFSLVVTLIWCLKNVTQNNTTCKFSKISSNQMTSSKTNEMLRLAIFWTLSYLIILEHLDLSELYLLITDVNQCELGELPDYLKSPILLKNKWNLLSSRKKRLVLMFDREDKLLDNNKSTT